jgi:hypothetical protein
MSMKPSLLLALALSLPAACAASSAKAQDDPAARIKTAIERDWTSSVDPSSGDVVVTSPIYAMQFNQGCVIHQLFFLNSDGRPSLARMVAADRYFAFASGDACATVDQALFFGIEPGNDVFGLMDFARRLQGGPRMDRDTLSKDALAHVPGCFLPDAMRSTRIARATSRRVGGARREEYTVVLACDALQDGKEIYAIGSHQNDAVTWDIRALTWQDVGSP